jgi:hypothetical protein
MCVAADASGQMHVATLASDAIEGRLEGGYESTCRESVQGLGAFWPPLS